MLKNILLELMGSFIIAFIMAFCRINNENDFLTLGLTYFLVVASLTYAFKSVSGSHFNPILTISLFISRQTTFNKAVLYVIAQLLGSLMAGFSVYALVKIPEDATDMYYGEPRIKDNQKLMGSFLEFIAMFLLVYVYTSIVSNVAAPKHVYGVAISSIYSASLITLSNYSGGCVNIVTLVGPAIFSSYYEDFGYYIISQLAGGLISATFYSIFLTKSSSDVEEEEQESEEIPLSEKPKAV